LTILIFLSLTIEIYCLISGGKNALIFLTNFIMVCLRLFYVAVTECPRLDKLKRKEIYLVHDSGGWEVQKHGTSGEGLRAVS
jgi:hypothetical protein